MSPAATPPASQRGISPSAMFCELAEKTISTFSHFQIFKFTHHLPRPSTTLLLGLICNLCLSPKSTPSAHGRGISPWQCSANLLFIQSLLISFNLFQSLLISFNLIQSLSISFNLIQSLSISFNLIQSLSISFNLIQSLSISFNPRHGIVAKTPQRRRLWGTGSGRATGGSYCPRP